MEVHQREIEREALVYDDDDEIFSAERRKRGN